VVRKRRLVLGPVDAPHVHAPERRTAGAVPERLERDRDFYRPAAVEAAHRQVVHGIEVRVDLALVRDLAVPPPADRVDRELDAVPLVVERVEQERDVIALEDVVVVTPHLVGDETRHVALPAAHRHVEAILVEEHPELGLLGGRGAFDRLLLPQIGHRGHRGVHRLLEAPVDVERGLEPHGPQRDAAGVVARHGGWSGRRHRTIRPRLPGRSRQRQRDDRCGNEGRRSQRQQRGAPGEGKDANGKRRLSSYPDGWRGAGRYYGGCAR